MLKTTRTQRHALSARLKALADPTRLGILSQLLAAPDDTCVCDIACCFDVGQPTISHHLKTLRQARLVRAQRRGTWIHYRADRQALEEVRRALAEL
ncbi:MAG: ArsR/SmtB family transcription factor [Gemmatimonadota bacterium]